MSKTVEQLAADLDEAHAEVVAAAQEFVRQIGVKPALAPVEMKIPGHVYADLAQVVQEWKDAGEALIGAQRKAAA